MASGFATELSTTQFDVDDEPRHERHPAHRERQCQRRAAPSRCRRPRGPARRTSTAAPTPTGSTISDFSRPPGLAPRSGRRSRPRRPSPRSARRLSSWIAPVSVFRRVISAFGTGIGGVSAPLSARYRTESDYYNVMTWSGGAPASAPYRSGKQPTVTPSTVFGRPAIARLTLGEPALECALVAHHQHHSLLRSHLREPLTERVAAAQHVVVVVEEEHPDDVHAVVPGLELGEDHLAELVARGVARRGEDVARSSLESHRGWETPDSYA